MSWTAICQDDYLKKITIGNESVKVITPKAERAMAKALLRLEILREQVCNLEMKTNIDSLYIFSLKYDIDQLKQVAENYKQAQVYTASANIAMNKEIAILKKQVRREKIKSWIGGVTGGAGALAVGVVTGFFIAQYK